MVCVKGYLIRHDTTLELPQGAKVLGVDAAEGHGNIALWVKQDGDNPVCLRRFVTYRNNDEIPVDLEPMRFVGTSAHGRLVFHTFELI